MSCSVVHWPGLFHQLADGFGSIGGVDGAFLGFFKRPLVRAEPGSLRNEDHATLPSTGGEATGLLPAPFE